ncbi:MAG: hypothetical protein IT376_00360 [Polyangiaceae bacterium]|nr:hypothetical protein [Polyangiaceae bacterium]
MLTFERRAAATVLEAFAPFQEPALAVRPGEVDWSRAFESMARASSPLAAFGLRAALWIALASPLLVFGSLRSFRSLEPARRSEVIERLLVHRFYIVRELALYLKLTACMAIFSSPAVRARSNYDRRPELAARPKSDPPESGSPEPDRRRLPVAAAGGVL